MKQKIAILKEILLHILFPKTCYCCHVDLAFQDTGFLCHTCSLVVGPVVLACKRCSAHLPSGGAFCYQCKGGKAKHFACSLVRSSLAFSPPVRALIHSYKYSSHKYLASFFVDFMVGTFTKEKAFLEVNLITAIPLYHARYKHRGYNQSELLALGLGQRVNIEVSFSVLKRVKNTKSQTKLKRTERIDNMKHAFECLGKVKGKTILLIDDVCTTGSTLEEAALALKACGAKKVFALVLARE